MTRLLRAAAAGGAVMALTADSALARTTGKDLAEPDWWRVLDALLLVAAHPAAP